MTTNTTTTEETMSFQTRAARAGGRPCCRICRLDHAWQLAQVLADVTKPTDCAVDERIQRQLCRELSRIANAKEIYDRQA